MVVVLFLGGSLVGLAVAVFAAQFLTSVPHLGQALAMISSHPTAPLVRPGQSSLKARIGAGLHRHLPSVLTGARAKDLEIVGVNPQIHLYTKFVYGLAGFIGLSLVGSLSSLLAGVSIAMPLGMGLLGAVLLWVLPDVAVKEKAAQARRDFSRSIAIYLELVASERRRDAPPAVALETAAAISPAWIFRRISQELMRARLDHTPGWEALIDLSRRIGVPELEEAAKIVRLSGNEGAEIYQALRNAGRSLRGKLLAEEHAAANKASERMTLFIAVLAMTFMGVIITPLMLSLL